MGVALQQTKKKKNFFIKKKKKKKVISSLSYKKTIELIQLDLSIAYSGCSILCLLGLSL